jgi:hypothetical protein
MTGSYVPSRSNRRSSSIVPAEDGRVCHVTAVIFDVFWSFGLRSFRWRKATPQIPRTAEEVEEIARKITDASPVALCLLPKCCNVRIELPAIIR